VFLARSGWSMPAASMHCNFAGHAVDANGPRTSTARIDIGRPRPPPGHMWAAPMAKARRCAAIIANAGFWGRRPASLQARARQPSGRAVMAVPKGQLAASIKQANAVPRAIIRRHGCRRRRSARLRPARKSRFKHGRPSSVVRAARTPANGLALWTAASSARANFVPGPPMK